MAIEPYLVDDLAEQVMHAAAPGAAERSSFFMDVMEAIPTIQTSAALKMSRGSSTLLHGGRVDRPGLIRSRIANRQSFVSGGIISNWLDNRTGMAYIGDGAKTGVIRGGLGNLMHRPGNIRRFATRDYFNTTPNEGRTKYTPFYTSSILNAPARGALGKAQFNWFNRLMGGNEGTGGLTGGRFQAGAAWGHLVDQDTGEMFSRGFGSRIAASARIGTMGAGAYARRSGSIGSFIESAYGVAPPTDGWSQRSASSLVAMSGRGPASARMGAWITGTQAGGIGRGAHETLTNFARRPIDPNLSDAARAAQLSAQNRASQALQGIRDVRYARSTLGYGATEKVTARSAIWRGARGAAMGTGSEGGRMLAAKAGLKLGASAAVRVGARFVPFLGWGLFAHDVSRFAGRTAARIGSTAVAAVGSYTAPMRTGVMQQSFTDNEVTRTSRARGVAMIQNSRLNARSVLGNESAAMARHFG